MTSNDLAVIVWTVQAGIGVLFSAAMMYSRHRNLQNLLRSVGNGDRDYRIFLANQDIRRSLVRYLAFLCGFIVGGLVLTIEYTDWIMTPVWLLQHWIWLLSVLMTLLAVNEVMDRWALASIRRRYRVRHTQYHPDAIEDGHVHD